MAVEAPKGSARQKTITTEQNFVIPAKAGIRNRQSAIPTPFSLWSRRKEIPAFAGMTSVCKDDSHYGGRSAEGFGATKDNNHRTKLRHSRESGNPEAAARNIGPVFLTETPQRDSRFRGNDECL